MRTVTSPELKRRLEKGDVPELIDVREPWEFEICRIEGSINIPMSDIVRARESLDRQTEKIIICHHGLRSSQVAAFLESIGFEAVVNLEGGIDMWARLVDPAVPTY